MSGGTRRPRGRMPWLRVLAIALGALSLASCRSMTAPVATAVTAGVMHHDDAHPRAAHGHAGHRHGCTDHPADAACPRCMPCRTCEPETCRPCPPLAIVPPPPVPVARICKVCDGGDHGAPAKPKGDSAIVNLTAGDTVARFRAADDDEDPDGLGHEGRASDSDCDCLTIANCACVCAPRFASVREVVMPHEDFAPTGPVAAALDAGPEVADRRQRSRAGTQRLPPVLARRALPELAVVEAAPPLGLDHKRLPGETPYVCTPAEDVLDVQPELARKNLRPKIAIAFDVPLAWTCLSQAQVMVQEQAADVVTVDRGTAVLRLKCPGRAELSLCKTAGSATARSGEELDFTIALVNTGDRTLEGIVLVDALPKRLSFVPDSADSTLPADFTLETADDGAVVLKWTLREPLAPGASGFVRFRTLVR